jgi:sugar/nucleoside kinase (ribokinase family)
VIFITQNDLLSIGHTAFDYLIYVEEFPSPNTSALVKKMKNLNGGAAANVAVVGSTLGLKMGLVSAVGGDFTDSKYQKFLKELDVDTSSMIHVEDENTPTAFVMTNNNNDQVTYFSWGAAENFKTAEVPKEAIKNAKAVHLATGEPSFNIKCGRYASEENKLISFDPGQDLHLYSAEDLKEMLKVATILFGNNFEIDSIKESLNMEINELLDFGPDIIIRTKGKGGSEIYSKDGKIDVRPFLRDSLDPTGAGDSYRAGFLKNYLDNKPLEYCGEFASAVSSFIVEKQGCQTNVPTIEMVIERMKE